MKNCKQSWLVLTVLLSAEVASAYSANRVWMDWVSSGRVRLTVQYTVLELKESREMTIEYRDVARATKVYQNLVAGADFYFFEDKEIKFVNKDAGNDPW